MYTIQIQARLPAFCSFSVFFRAEKQNTLKKTGSSSALKTVSQQKRFFVSYSHLGKKNTRTLSNLSIALLQHHDKVANHDCWPAQLEMYFVTMSNKYYRCMTSRSLFHWRNGSETIVENFDFFYLLVKLFVSCNRASIFFVRLFHPSWHWKRTKQTCSFDFSFSLFPNRECLQKKGFQSNQCIYRYFLFAVDHFQVNILLGCRLYVARYRNVQTFDLFPIDLIWRFWRRKKNNLFPNFCHGCMGYFTGKKRRKMEKKRMWTFHISYYSVKWLVPDWISDTCFVHHSVSTSNTSHIGTCRMKDKFGQGSY